MRKEGTQGAARVLSFQRGFPPGGCSDCPWLLGTAGPLGRLSPRLSSFPPAGTDSGGGRAADERAGAEAAGGVCLGPRSLSRGGSRALRAPGSPPPAPPGVRALRSPTPAPSARGRFLGWPPSLVPLSCPPAAIWGKAERPLLGPGPGCRPPALPPPRWAPGSRGWAAPRRAGEAALGAGQR